MRTTRSQLHPDIGKGSPPEHGRVWHTGQTEGALFRSKCSITGSCCCRQASASLQLIPRDALCTVSGKRCWNSERDDESVNAGCRCRTSHQAERQIQSGVWNRKIHLCETEGDTGLKRNASVCAQQTRLGALGCRVKAPHSADSWPLPVSGKDCAEQLLAELTATPNAKPRSRVAETRVQLLPQIRSWSSPSQGWHGNP